MSFTGRYLQGIGLPKQSLAAIVRSRERSLRSISLWPVGSPWRFQTLLALLALPFLIACNIAQQVSFNQLENLDEPGTVRFFYPSAGGKVEAYLARPRGKGPFPLVILLHGHSFRGRGAEQVLPVGEAIAQEICFASVAISLPGYGATENPHGASEEITRQAVRDGLSIARQLRWVDKQQVLFYGMSRGATVAAALLNEVDGLSGAVLYAGAYDLGRLYRETPSFWVRRLLNADNDGQPKLPNFLGEASKWHAPTLILHGEQDSLVPVSQSLLLRDQLKAAGVRHKLVVYTDAGHLLPRAQVREQTMNFFKEIIRPACPSANLP